MTFRNSILAGTTLVRNAIQSEGFVSGSVGWRITRDGNAEFNDGTFRGTVTITNPSGAGIVIDSDDAVLRFVDADGNVLAELDSTTEFFGSSLFAFTIWDFAGNRRMALTGLGVAFEGNNGPVKIQSGSALGDDFQMPQLRVEPTGTDPDLAGRFKGEFDSGDNLATSLLQSPAVTGNNRASLRLESDSNTISARVRVPSGTDLAVTRDVFGTDFTDYVGYGVIADSQNAQTRWFLPANVPVPAAAETIINTWSDKAGNINLGTRAFHLKAGRMIRIVGQFACASTAAPNVSAMQLYKQLGGAPNIATDTKIGDVRFPIVVAGISDSKGFEIPYVTAADEIAIFYWAYRTASGAGNTTPQGATAQLRCDWSVEDRGISTPAVP